MNLRSVVGAGLAVATLTTSVALLPSPMSVSSTPMRPATQIVPNPPPGQVTVVTYYLNGAHTDDSVGQRIVGNCPAYVPWGNVTTYYTISFMTCSN